MSVSVSVVEATNPEALTGAAVSLGDKVAQVDSTLEAQREAIRDLKGGWQGTAADAALARAERDLAKQTGFRDRLQQAQRALQTGGTYLGQAKGALVGIVNTLRAQGWQVSDDGVATPPPTLPPVLKNTAQAWTAAVQRLLTLFGEIDKQTAGSLPKFSPLSTDGPVLVDGDKRREDEEQAKRAEQDVQDALAGDQEAARRVEEVLGKIVPGQPLTPEQGSYLSQMQAQQNGMTVEELKTAEQRLGDQKHIIADSWQLMSNDDVTFPETPTEVGALDNPNRMVQGGFEKLPQGVQQAIKSSGVLYADQMKDISGIVKDGNPALQTGTTLDREMLRKADTMMDTPIWEGDPASSGNEVGRDPFLDPVVSDIFGSAGRDHQVIHDHLLGIPDENGVRSDGDDFLHDVTHHAWADHGAAAGSLFSWTESAYNGPEETLAGETAQKYGSYIGSHDNDLLALPGEKTLGEVNPNLVQGLAHGLAPYIPDIAGLSSEDTKNGFDPLDPGNIDAPTAKGIFSVLSTDKDASDFFNGVADAHILASQGEYAQAVKDGVPNIQDYNAKLFDAAKLQGLVETGTANAAYATDLNADEQAKLAYERQKSAYEFGVKAASTGLEFIPKVGPVVGPSAELLGSALQDSIVGPPPTPNAQSPIISNMGQGEAARQVLNSLIANDIPIQGLPREYYVPVDPTDPSKGMRIGTVEEIKRFNEVWVPDQQWKSKLDNAVGHTVGEDTNPIDDIAQTYEDVVKKPNP
jgi:uncharacterized protein YukE